MTTLETTVGKITLFNVEFYISDAVTVTLIGNDLLAALGISPVQQLSRVVQSGCALVDVDSIQNVEYIVTRMATLTGDQSHNQHPTNDHEPATADVDIGPINVREIEIELNKLVHEARQNGMSRAGLARLRLMLKRHVNEFRTKLGHDAPVDVEPMVTKLKPGATPYRCKPRTYNPNQKEFLDDMIRMLKENGLIYLNLNSRWASPVLVVKKPHGNGYRLCVDLRQVNARSVPTAWPMPNVEAATRKLNGMTCFFTIDAHKGFWLMPLAKECQEIFSFMTDDAVYTPTRSIQGGMNSALQFQARVARIFDDMQDHLLIWIDDLLGFARSEAELLAQLSLVLERCGERNLKLNPTKCTLFARELKWCGRIYSKDGIRHDPERIESLMNMPQPTTIKDLQQFLWAANWMRTSVPGYAHIVGPLQAIIDEAHAELRRIQPDLRNVQSSSASSMGLIDLGWNTVHSQAFEDLRFALINHVQLAYPKPDYQTCLFTDASEVAWSAVITQIPREDIALPVHEQRHEPLAFYGKRFSGSELRWPIVEKEAAAIIYATERGDFLLQTSRPFLTYCDHRNLTYIFNPDSEVKKHTAQKLQRWALHLQGFDYEIREISGVDNVWADLLTRWGSGRIALKCRTTRLLKMDNLRATPRKHPDFSWPTEQEIRDSQRLLTREEKIEDGIFFDDTDRLWKSTDGATLIPIHVGCRSLRLRILIIGHSGSAGHRASEVAKQTIMSRFCWPDIDKDVEQMCQQCIHCITTRGGRKVPRPLGEALHGQRPFQVMAMDYLYVEPVRGTDHPYKYILVMKDDYSGYVRLVPCQGATSRAAADAINQWIADFETPEYLVTDGGSHFTAEVIKELSRLREIQHHITLAYCPWANGTVERANRTVLNMLRSILSEAQISTHNWPYLCPVVQHAINHAPSKRLAGNAPYTVITGNQPESPLDHIWDPAADQFRPVSAESVVMYLAEMQVALDELHKAVDDAKTAQHAANVQQRARRLKKYQSESFIPGDYVLNAKAVLGPAQKLAAHWRGPYRVVRRINDQVYELEDILTSRRFEAHTQRIRRYADEDLNVTVELKQQLQQADQKLLVDDLLDCRLDRDTHELQIQVAWSGFELSEATWEPAARIAEDVPQLLPELIRKLGDDHQHAEALSQLVPPTPKRTRTKGTGSRRKQRRSN
ncbi:hypothetical protein PBRA_009453 [Plasmodiophora brassicae]|uniref:Reverse transcriptase n=1 Tax=Plasmodiophora brassicae TaxID=37360 RepID=A0A0G4J7H8_PLABS|nr:hypothetical protein PBRA_009453 [Plasmodiophora brassicae]